MTSRGDLGSIVVLAALLSGCDAYERTNPLDPSYPMEVSIVGPDTIFSVNDTVQFQIVTEPSHPGLPFAWSSSSAARLLPISDTPGRFTSTGNGVVVVRAELGSRTVEKEVVVAQRAVRLLILPPPTTEMVSFGEIIQLTASIVDAKDTPVQGAAADLQWTASNPTVVELVNGRVTARANGESWIHAESLGQKDSLHVKVQQIPNTLQFGSSSYTIPLPGASVQTTITARDARNNVIASPAGLTLTSSRSTFQVSSSGLVQSTGFGSTEITATLGELQATTHVRVTGGTSPMTTAVAAGVTTFAGTTQSLLLIELDARDAELDLDQATLEVYSAAEIWMVTRVIPLEQGFANYLAVVAIPNAAGAGTVRIRLRDAAQNNSSLTTWQINNQPRPGSPQVSIVNGSIAPNGHVTLLVNVSQGPADLRMIHLFGFTATGEVAMTASWPQTESGTRQLSAPVPADGSIVAFGVVATDTDGNMSLVRRWEP